MIKNKFCEIVNLTIIKCYKIYEEIKHINFQRFLENTQILNNNQNLHLTRVF